MNTQKNCYNLTIPSLSSSLEEKLINFGQSISLEESFNPSNECDSTELLIREKFHKQTNTTGSHYRAVALPDDLQLEINLEMKEKFEIFSHYIFYIQIIDGGEVLVPHRDYGREFAVLYKLSDDKSNTHFYKRKVIDPKRYNFSLEEIEGPIETYFLNKSNWYVLNTNTVHNIADLNSRRIALATHDYGSYEEFIKNYSPFISSSL
jgi:hypothetical protein